LARYTDSVCKICRRESMKLFLKGDRCYTDKCSFERRGYAPGQHGLRRGKVSEYALRLREKQKVKRLYGLLENQFHGYFKKAERSKGVTGENLLNLLERRLDNVIFRMGFADSRSDARQLVKHNHFLVNGKKVNMPSFLVKTGMVIELKEKSKKNLKINAALDSVNRRGIPEWLETNRENLKGTVKSLPKREYLTLPIQEQLIVELYSK
jgi:small subunit ribosomal protein S4